MNQIIRAIGAVKCGVERGNFFRITFTKTFRRPNQRGNFNHVNVALFLQRVPRKISPLINFLAVVGNVNQHSVFVLEAADNFVDNKIIVQNGIIIFGSDLPPMFMRFIFVAGRKFFKFGRITLLVNSVRAVKMNDVKIFFIGRSGKKFIKHGQ